MRRLLNWHGLTHSDGVNMNALAQEDSGQIKLQIVLVVLKGNQMPISKLFIPTYALRVS